MEVVSFTPLQKKKRNHAQWRETGIAQWYSTDPEADDWESQQGL
jgi:hypothetical protein